VIRAIIFDLDGVIADTEPLHYASFQEVLKRLGIRVSKREWSTRYIGTGSMHIMQDILRRNGVREDAAKLVEERGRIYARMLKKRMIKPINGFMRFFQKVKRMGLPIAVVSGGHRTHIKTTLRKLGIGRGFAIVSIEDVRNRKPHPEGFLLAAQRLGARPGECIAFEDSIAGVEAARSAGMIVVALTTSTGRKNLRRADITIKDFNDKNLRAFMSEHGVWA